MISEGSRVAYVGEDPTQDVGATGKVLSMSGAGCHVMWQTGPRMGQVELLDRDEVVEQGRAAEAVSISTFDYDLDTPSLPTISVRALYDDAGERGLLSALEEAGRIAPLAEYVDGAVDHLAARIRQDPGFSEVLAQLDPDEGAALISRVAGLVLMDRISGEDD